MLEGIADAAGVDAESARGQGARELPGARREVEQGAAGTESEPLAKERNRCVGILGARAIVELRDEAESVRLRVDPLRHGSRGRGR